MAKRGWGIKEGPGLDAIHAELGITKADQKKKRAADSTNETDTSVKRDGNRWTRYWEKKGGQVYKALHD